MLVILLFFYCLAYIFEIVCKIIEGKIYLLTLICITLLLWYCVPCNGWLPLFLVYYNNFIICLTYIKLYYFVDAGFWRRNAVTKFNWFISSYSLNWLANISFVWTTDEWFHQTTIYFSLSFMKTVLENWKTILILL